MNNARIAAYFKIERFLRDNASDDIDYATRMEEVEILRALPSTHAAVVDAAKDLVRAWAYHVYTIKAYGEGEAELHFSKVYQAEEMLQTAVANLLAAETGL